MHRFPQKLRVIKHLVYGYVRTVNSILRMVKRLMENTDLPDASAVTSSNPPETGGDRVPEQGLGPRP